MRSPGAVETQRLEVLLEAALLREARHWRAPVFKQGGIQASDISWSQHQDVILWLGDMSRLFSFCPETFALGVCVLNRLLSAVKAQPKYLKCIAFTSLVLAAKINEEDEVTGSVSDLVSRSGCSFSTAEILRMERIILDKLHWDLLSATAVDFVHIFHALLVSAHPHLVPSIGWASVVAGDPVGAPAVAPGPQKSPPPAGLQAALWTRQVQHCMACHQLWQFRGSTLALAIITLELELLTPDWFSVFTDLMKRAQVDSGEFIHCKETVDQFLHSLEFSLPANAVYIFDSAQIHDDDEDEDEERSRSPTQRRHRHLARRGRCRSHDGEEDDADDFYDGFRRLYQEEAEGPGPEGKDLEGLFASKMKNVSPCPPLHPPIN